MFLKRLLSLLMAVLLTMIVFPAPADAESEALTDTVIRSAPLVKADSTLDGMVRVYLSSLGSVTSLDVTVVGSYSVDGAVSMTLTDGQTVNIGFNTVTGQITMTVNGRSYAMGTEMALRRHQASGESALRIAQANRPNNLYPGDLQLISRTSGSAYKLYPIVHVYIEYYLYGVVPYEMSSSWPAEALRAQSVAARTYTLNRMNGRASYIYDLVDTASDQVYNGYVGTETNATRAVDATKGIVIMNNGKLSGTYYTASNGGQTEAVANAWGSTAYPYLGVKDDPFDLANVNANRRKLTVYSSFNASEQNSTLQSILTNKAKSIYGSGVSIVSINSITPHTPKYDAPSRLYTQMDFGVTLSTGGSATLSFSIFDELESQLGLSINSTKNELWYVERDGSDFIIRVGRWGHGIGMSQRGAQQMANMGYTYDQILGFYYEGCERVQYTFTHTILPSIGSGDDPVVSTEAPATIAPENGCNARIQLVGIGDSLPVRYTPSQTGKVLIAVTNGASVNVLNYGSEWTLIQVGQINGYVPTQNLVISSTPPTGTGVSATNITQWGTVTGSTSLNLRDGGSYSSNVIGAIPGGAVVAILTYGSDWSQVQYGQQVGYAATSYLTLSATYPQTIEGSGSSAMVSLPGSIGAAPLRSTASTSGTIILYVDHGTQVIVHSNDGSWCRVSVSGVTGYMLASALDFAATGVTPTDEPLGSGELYAIVASEASTLNLRSGPSTLYDVIAEIPKGTQIVVTSYGSQWCAVRWGSLTGYVMTEYLSFDAEASTQTPTAAPATATPTPTASPTPTPTFAATPVPTFVPVNMSATVVLNAQLREEANTSSALLATIPAGSAVSVIAAGTSWCQVVYDGMTGWVLTSQLYLREEEATPTPTVPVQTDEDDRFTESIAPEKDGLTAWIVSTVTSVNLRASASTEAEVYMEISGSTCITVLEKGDTWSFVLHDGMAGYVFSQYITYAEPMAAIGLRYISTAVDPLALRDEPATSGKLLARMDRGSTVTLLEELGDWCYVQYGQMLGYCAARYLSVEKPEVRVTDDTRLLDSTLTEVTGWEAIVNEKGSESVFARQWCTTDAPEVMEIQPDTRVTIVQKGDIWCLIAMEGKEGYCLTSQLTLIPPTE